MNRIFCVTMILVSGCYHVGELYNGDTDSDTDTGTDSDADTDTDSESNADSDTGPDSDSDADSDGDSDGDADTDADSDTDTDADSDGDTDGDTDGDSDGDTDTSTTSDTDVIVDFYDSVAGGFQHSMVLSEDGAVFAWGMNDYGQIGDNTSNINRLNPVQVLGTGGSGNLTGIVSIAAGLYHSMALKEDGTVWAWGNNVDGQIGNNSSGGNVLTPVQVVGVNGIGDLTGIVAIAAGYSYSIALKSDGTVCAWGNNYYGQLGDNSQANRTIPVKVCATSTMSGTCATNLQNIVAIAAGIGSTHSIALKSDGTVYAWGYNNAGQIGNNSSGGNVLTPVQVVGVNGIGDLTGIVAIAAGTYHSLALSEDGTVYAWGYNNAGQIGNNSSGGNVLTPVQVVGVNGIGDLTGIVAIAAGGYHSIAMKGDKTVFTWGKNDSGQIGNGTTISPVLTPTVVTMP
jgi:alpha-tubulin suppressor-like RCC1 family protein